VRPAAKARALRLDVRLGRETASVSGEGRGATFHFSLPLMPKHDNAGETTNAPAVGVPSLPT
jgi:hypothetical protein